MLDMLHALKKHLMPLANSMTCAESLVGFNSGGYKALFRSLNIQVLFIETTLFTPRKCFERAAEKCYDDSLSSIVASYSWDKHVTVGTGLQFDSLWDQKKVGFDPMSGMDVYNFLHMISSAGRINSNPACLGEEVDLMELDEIKSNPAWQEIEVDNLMGRLDEAIKNHISSDLAKSRSR